jgi:hypothetical protein
MLKGSEYWLGFCIRTWTWYGGIGIGWGLHWFARVSGWPEIFRVDEEEYWEEDWSCMVSGYGIDACHWVWFIG